MAQTTYQESKVVSLDIPATVGLSVNREQFLALATANRDIQNLP